MLDKVLANLEAIERLFTDEIADRLTVDEIKQLIALSEHARSATRRDLDTMLRDTEEILDRLRQKLN